ncbi:DUF1493 family protein [Pseudoalteromonas sp. S3431]|uniref:DUF1493 family protein n=2 Tax=unclassified Pseudoalteromonas TaxID=194690 RepID=UPI00049F9D28|nr:DUF1493 family protein [Pseudoalteromonas sp. S3431]KDC55725.1 hypothetical protein DO88_02125 [Pseudoalteromonas sp. S3431]
MIRDKVVEIISQEMNLPIESISMDSTFLVDLNIDGDDAWEVFERCYEQFNLDLCNLKFTDYFSSEPCYKGAFYMFRKLKLKDEHLVRKKERFTVADLVNACEQGDFEKLV